MVSALRDAGALALAPRRARLDALTGIRPLASLAVFFFHFGRPLLAGQPSWLRSLLGSGFVAVSFFYVLSGFVLTLGQRRQLLDGALDARRFVTRRISRLVPTAWLALALLLPLALHAPWGRATGAFPSASSSSLLLTGLLHLLLLQAWAPSLALTWNLPAWSVSVELAFYLAFPRLAGALTSRSRRTRWIALGAAWAAGLALALGYHALAPDGGAIGPDSDAPGIDLLKFFPLARLPEFAFGVALGTLAPSSGSWRCPRALGPAALAVVAVVLSQAHRLPYALLHNALLLPAFGAILVAVASARGLVARVLSSAPLVRLGRAGYAFYLLQMPLMYLVLALTDAGLVRWSGAGFFVRFLLLVLVAALVVQRFVEAPLQRRLQSWLEGAGAKG